MYFDGMMKKCVIDLSGKNSVEAINPFNIAVIDRRFPCISM